VGVSPALGTGPHSRRPVQVAYFIDSLFGVGGAEISLARLVRALPPERFGCRVVTFGGDATGLALIEQSGWPVHRWTMHNLYGPTAFAVARRIRRMVREEGIDIVHTFFQTSDLWAGPIAKASGARYLISSRRDMGILRHRKHRIGYRMLHPLYDQVHAVSESVRQYTIAADGLDPNKVATVYNGIEVGEAPSMTEQEQAPFRRSMGIEEGQIVVTTIANWRQVKGIDILVRAGAIVAERDPRVKFLVAGEYGKNPPDNAYCDSVLELARSVGAERFMKFLGSWERVRDLLGISDIFVLPSRSEGLSNALLEAMESSVPCIATDVGGNPEIVVDGVTGRVVPSEDPERLAQAILDLVADREGARRMGEAGRRRVIEKFTVAAMAAQVVKSYEMLLGREQTPDLSR
jgi:glycosyltransferase involved in cell wall biosynthesis